jgi:hypothetical protein
MEGGGVAVTDRERVFDVFYSEIRQKYELPQELLYMWFVMAIGDYELDVAPVGYDEETEMFEGASGALFNTLGLMMARFYLKREQSRINKMNNIIGRDLSLNATGDAKKAVQAEYENLLAEIEEKLHKQKVHAYS